jgi:hypothetical protein
LSDSDEPVASSAVKRRKPAPGREPSNSPLAAIEDDDEDEIVPPSTARKLRETPMASFEVSDDSDEPVPSSPRKRLRRGNEKEKSATPQTPRQTSKQAKLDIEEDLEDLQDSGKSRRVLLQHLIANKAC